MINRQLPAVAKQTIRSIATKSDRLPADGKQVVGYALHGQFTRNNTILTLSQKYKRVGKLAEGLTEQELLIDHVRPRQDPKIVLSTGSATNARNSKQGEYEAAFNTAAKMFEKMEQKGYLNNIELVFRQFQPEGREAFINALNGKEGMKVRQGVVRVTDASKIKFGGHRAPGRRRV